MKFPQPFTSVTRWLLVVIGCAVLATAQPMRAAPSDAPASTLAPDTVIYPKGSPERPLPAESDSSRKSLILVSAVLLAAVGVWVFVKKRQSGPIGSRGARKLQIDETRPLGNRQYLVVADYNGRKFLLGVTPGQIQMLAPLDDAARTEGKP